MARKSRKNQPEETTVQQPSAQTFSTAIYARLSVENSGKDDDGAALENQIEVCKEYISECPYLSLTEVYADNGKTGTVFDRPQFNRLMEDIRNGKINCLVVRDLSRFGRDYVETGTYLERIFPKLEVRFISVKEQYDSFATDGSNESLMIPLQNLINDLYSKDISRKVSTALRIQMENGEFHWRKLPYGYRWNEDKTEIVPDENTAQYIKDIFRWKLEGVSMPTMLDRLEKANAPIPEILQRTDENLEGVNTVCWSKSTIFDILKNPAYAGDFAVGRSRSAIYAGIKNLQVRDKNEWYITQDAHESLVSREDFDAVQKMMEQASMERQEKMQKSREHRESLVDLFDKKVFCGDCQKRLYFHRKKIDKIMQKDESEWVKVEDTHEPLISHADFMAVKTMLGRDRRSCSSEDDAGLFSGFLFCGDCKQTMVRKTVPSKNKKYIYYVCAASKRRECSQHSISEKEVERTVFHAVQDQVELVLNLDKVLTYIEHLPSADRRVFNYETQITKLEEEIERCRKLKLRLYEDLSDGVIDKAEYMEFRDSYTRTIDEKKEALARVQREKQDTVTAGASERSCKK